MNAQDEMPYRRTLGAKTYFSQAGQDLFVLSMLENKSAGVYCEIGGAHPIESNNTFLLERHHGIQSNEEQCVYSSRCHDARLRSSI
jgi:hypothetical protein